MTTIEYNLEMIRVYNELKEVKQYDRQHTRVR